MSQKIAEKPVDLTTFDWLDLQREIKEAAPSSEESFYDRLVRKSQNNPLVPIGAVATTAALIYGLWNFRLGRRQMSQYMMRTRVGAQGFTILAILLGYVYGIEKKKPPVN